MFHRLPVFLFFLLLNAGKGFSQQPKLVLPIGHSSGILHAAFSPDGKKILTLGAEGVAKLWEARTGKLLRDFKASGDASIAQIKNVEFVAAGKKILIRYEFGSGETWVVDVATASEWLIWNRLLIPEQFSPDGKRMIIPDYGGDTIYSTDTYKALIPLKTNGDNDILIYTPNGKKIVSASTLPNGADETRMMVRVWDAVTGKPLTGYKKQADDIYSIHASPDSKKILLSGDHSAVIADLASLTVISNLRGYISQQGIGNNLNGDETIQFSPDGKKLIQRASTYYDKGDEESFELSLKTYDSLTVWDVQTGMVLYRLTGLQQQAGFSSFSPDGKKIVFIDTSHKIKIGDAGTGKVLFELTGHTNEILKALFSPDGKTIISASADSTVKLWDATTGKFIREFAKHTGGVNDVAYSPDGKKIVTASADHSAIVWDVETGKELVLIKGRTNDIIDARFNPGGKSVNLIYENYTLAWDIDNRRLSSKPKEDHAKKIIAYDISPDSLYTASVTADFLMVKEGNSNEFLVYGTSLTGEREIYRLVRFSPDGNWLLIITEKNIVKLFDIRTQKLLLSFVALDSVNFLVSDPKSHYDGTDAARKLVHFTCGDEVIELDQVKEQLWIPNLARRINNGDIINARSIDELDICGLTPLIEQGKTLAGEFYFRIKPRSGGLGETVVGFNGTPTLSIQPSQLKKAGSYYELRLNKKDLSDYFIAGQENSVSVKSYTANNNTSSRPFIVIDENVKEKTAPPNLFGVMIGVSDYKGEKMDLEYAAIDAAAITSAVTDAAKKLLGNEHVFMYSLTTDSGHVFPEKKTIKRTFDDIAAKAGPNDILFIFLSGHGVMLDKTKQFYYMTADASSLVDESVFKDVGISMSELADWIKPQNIKAQKRILILDACKSGQAINDIITPDQRLLAVKGDGDAQQVKAIDKLNERSGLFILSASASTQLAFESGIYEHGYLTYSLLNAIKEKPDILEDGKYLNVSRWFNTAAQTVGEMTKDQARQEPQIVTNTDFNVGLVDNEVTERINLAVSKTLFGPSNFLNSKIFLDSSLINDDLRLGQGVDKKLGDLSATAGKNIVFVSSINSSGTWSLTGGYTVAGNAVTITVTLKKDNASKKQFTKTGTKDKLNELADAIITGAMEWIEENK